MHVEVPFSPLQAVEQYTAQVVKILLIQQKHPSWFTVRPTDFGQQFAVSTRAFKDSHLDDKFSASECRLDRQRCYGVVAEGQLEK
ncbi:MAG: hypothetical protein ACKVT0_05360 [Planctomycetaceae bacterium]